MVSRWIPSEIPRNIETALGHLTTAVRRSSYESMEVGVDGYGVNHISLFESDETQRFFSKMHGDWYELKEVPDE